MTDSAACAACDVTARKPDPTPEDGAIYYAWRLGYGSVERALDFIDWSTVNTDWGEGTPREREKWHERTTRRFLLAYIKEHAPDGT